MGNVILFLSCLLSGGMLIGMGIFTRGKKEPVGLNTGETVPKDSISDVPAFNRAVGWMWIILGLVFILAAVFAVWTVKAATVLIFVGTAVGVPGIMLGYKRIRKKYRRK